VEVFHSIFQVTIDVSSPEAGVIEKVTAVSHILCFQIYFACPASNLNCIFSSMVTLLSSDHISALQFTASEGDTVTPGTKIAMISKSAASSEAHAPPSEETSQKETPPPPPPEKPKVQEKPPKVESVKTQASKLASPSEPQLPPKERERRVTSHPSIVYT
jgi:outer membrane biosynthesis protein TonB